MTPVICLVTARQLYGVGGDGTLVGRVAAAARAGVDLIQVRERDLDGGRLMHLVTACVRAVAGTRTRVIVNDRLDVALAAGAHGVHLRADSLPAARVRAVSPPGFLLGRSIHSVEAAGRATSEGGLDYLVFGTIFPSASKPRRDAAGPETLRRITAATALPVLAIGGIGPTTAALAARAGAAGVAAISLFAATDDEQLRLVVGTLREAFDTPRSVP